LFFTDQKERRRGNHPPSPQLHTSVDETIIVYIMSNTQHKSIKKGQFPSPKLGENDEEPKQKGGNPPLTNSPIKGAVL